MASDKALVVETQGEGPTLLCLHGLGGRGHWFHGLAQRLKPNYRVAYLDMPGTGTNREGHAPFTLEKTLQALTSWITTEKGPITVVGHSMGTIVALKLLALLPGRFDSLVFVGGLPEIIPGIRQRLGERKELILRQGHAGLGLTVAKGVFSKTSFDLHPNTIQKFADDFEALTQAEYLEGIDILLTASARAEMALMRLPCLVLSGGEDTYAPPSEVDKFIADLPIPVHRILLPGLGHMTFLEDPDTFANSIRDFLQMTWKAAP